MQTEEPATLKQALVQRNQAITCAILSIIVSIALIMDNFLGQHKKLVLANQQIHNLQTMVIDVQNALTSTQRALWNTENSLRQTQTALAQARATVKTP